MPIVTNIFWNDAGLKLFVLYDDYTYDIFRFDYKLAEYTSDRKELKAFLNLRQLRIKKYTKETVKGYIDDHIEKWKMEKGL